MGLTTTSGSSANLTLGVGTGSAVATPVLSLNTWTFVAVSYDAASDTVRFYTGGTGTSVSLLSTVPGFTAAAPDINGAGTTSSVFIGNRSTAGRAFAGYIDDTRLYDGLFAAGDASSSLDSVRLSAIPEPSTLGLIGIGMAIVLSHPRRSHSASSLMSDLES